jgi:hypothetical protein
MGFGQRSIHFNSDWCIPLSTSPSSRDRVTGSRRRIRKMRRCPIAAEMGKQAIAAAAHHSALGSRTHERAELSTHWVSHSLRTQKPINHTGKLASSVKR